jgi:hypothetical protein
MMTRTLFFSLTQRVGGLLLGSVILWQVARFSMARRGRAVVHVSMPDVIVTIDDARYRVNKLWDSPIICELRPGRHTARMIQGGRVLYQEEFTIGSGEELVLRAWDGYNDGRSPKVEDRGE